MRRSCLLFIFLLRLMYMSAQQNYADTSLVSRHLADAKHLYDTFRGNELPVYNGIQYYPYSSSIEGLPYYGFSEWQKGNVVFDGILYENIFMRYELVKDQLIITSNEMEGVYIILFSPRVKEFSFSGFKFIRLDKEKNTAVPGTGFYRQLAAGKVTALQRTTRTIEERVETSGISRKFVQETHYYIEKDNKYYSIKSKGDLLGVLREHKSEIQQLLDKNNLGFRKNREETIIAATEFYNQAN